MLSSSPRALVLAFLPFAAFLACGGNIAADAPPPAGDTASRPEAKSGLDASTTTTTTTTSPHTTDAATTDARAPKGDPPLVLDAATPVCSMPTLDPTICTVDADCTRVFAGCYCGAQPVTGINVQFAARAQACEDLARIECALGCASFPGYTSQTNSAIATDPDMIEAFCDTGPESGVCLTRFR